MNFNGFDTNEKCLIEAKINFLDSKILTDDFKKEIAKILISDTTDKKLENVPNYKKRSAEPDDYILKNEELNIIIVFLESHTIGERTFFMQIGIKDDELVEGFLYETYKKHIKEETDNIKTNSEMFSLDGIATMHTIPLVHFKSEIDAKPKLETYLLFLVDASGIITINNQIPSFENKKKINVVDMSYYMMIKFPIDKSRKFMESEVVTYINIFTGEEKTINTEASKKELEMLGFELNCNDDDDDDKSQEQLATMIETFYENADESEKTPENKKAMESIVNLYRNMSIETIDNEQKN